MKLTRPRIACLALPALLLAALGIDRLVLAPGNAHPSAAVAAPVQPVTAAPRPGNSLAPVEPTSPTPSLAARLESLAAEKKLDVTGVKDGFAPSSQWMSHPEPEKAEVAQGSPAWRFAKEHRLWSVLVFGDGGSVTVNSTVVRLNQEIDGFKLVSLTDRTAVFQRGGESVELKLESASTP